MRSAKLYSRSRAGARPRLLYGDQPRSNGAAARRRGLGTGRRAPRAGHAESAPGVARAVLRTGHVPTPCAWTAAPDGLPRPPVRSGWDSAASSSQQSATSTGSTTRSGCPSGFIATTSSSRSDRWCSCSKPTKNRLNNAGNACRCPPRTGPTACLCCAKSASAALRPIPTPGRGSPDRVRRRPAHARTGHRQPRHRASHRPVLGHPLLARPPRGAPKLTIRSAAAGARSPPRVPVPHTLRVPVPHTLLSQGRRGCRRASHNRRRSKDVPVAAPYRPRSRRPGSACPDLRPRTGRDIDEIEEVGVLGHAAERAHSTATGRQTVRGQVPTSEHRPQSLGPRKRSTCRTRWG